MKTKMVFLSVIVLSMLMTSISAQTGQGQGQRVHRTPEEIAKSQVEWMKTDLKLDEGTQKKVYDTILKYAKQSSVEREKLMPANDRDAMRAKMMEIMAARDKELKAILGDSSFEIFKAKEAEKRQEMMKQRGY